MKTMTFTFVLLASLVSTSALAGSLNSRQCRQPFWESEFESYQSELQQFLVSRSLADGENFGKVRAAEILKAAGGRTKKVVDYLAYTFTARDIVDRLLGDNKLIGNYIEGLADSEQVEEFRASKRAKLLAAMKSKLKTSFVPAKPAALADEIGMDHQLFNRVFDSTVLASMWTELIEDEDIVEAIRKKIRRAATHVMAQKDTATAVRGLPREAQVEDIFARFVEQEGVDLQHQEDLLYPLDLYRFRAMIGDARERRRDDGMYLPQVYSGTDQLVKDAASTSKSAMAGLKPAEFGDEYAQKTLTIAKKAKRIMFSALTAGLPVNWDMIKSALNYCKRKDAYLFLGLTNLQFLEIPEELLEDPRIRVVTNNIELGPEYLIMSTPVGPKIESPAAFLKKSGLNARGQSVLAFHPQLSLDTLSTVDNDLNPHRAMFTGTVNLNHFPYNSAISGKTAAVGEKKSINSFMLLEKTDRASGVNGSGTPGRYHPRPLIYVDDREHGGKAGFTDLGVRYEPDGSVSVNRVARALPGDLHDRFANRRFLSVLVEQVLKNRSLTPYEALVIQDGFEGDSINHHEAKNLRAQHEKQKAGRLSLVTEVNGYQDTLNAVMVATDEFKPAIRINLANHDDWLPSLIKTFAGADPINQGILAELQAIALQQGMNPLFYLLAERAQELNNLRRPDDRYDALTSPHRAQVPSYDPERIYVLDASDKDATGPYYRQTYTHLHSHIGLDGARGSSIDSFARALDAAFLGHTHKPAIRVGNANNGQLIINVGVSSYLERGYNEGGPSSWGNALGLAYEDGTQQLLLYDPSVNSFYADDSVGFLPPDQFFTRDPVVIRSSNEILGSSAVNAIPDQNNFKNREQEPKAMRQGSGGSPLEKPRKLR